MVWAAILLDGSSEDADWPKRRAAASTIHATGDSTGPAGPPVNPVDAANAETTADTTEATDTDTDTVWATTAGAGATTDATTAAVRAAPTASPDATADVGVDASGVDGATPEDAARVDPADTAPAVSLPDTATDCLTLVTTVIDDGCGEPDDFFTDVDFSDIVVDTDAWEPSTLCRAGAVLLSGPRGESTGEGTADPATGADGVVPTEPDGVEVVLEVVDTSVPGAADATPGDMVTADPMPNATANAPTRPTCCAYPIECPPADLELMRQLYQNPATFRLAPSEDLKSFRHRRHRRTNAP